MTVLRFPQVDLHQAQSPNSMIPITTIGITTLMAMFQCAMWLSGLFLGVGADTILDSVENVDGDDWDEEKDEEKDEGEDDGEDEGEKSDEAGDPERLDCVVCGLLEDERDANDLLDWACASASATCSINNARFPASLP